MLQQAAASMPDSLLPRLWLVSTLMELGRLEEAATISMELRDLDSEFSALSWADSFKSETHQRLRKNMLAAGFRD